MRIYKTTKAQREATAKYFKTERGKEVLRRSRQRPEAKRRAALNQKRRLANQTRTYIRQIKCKVPIEIIIERDGTGYHAYSPTLKGLHTEADERYVALHQAYLASVAYINSCIKNGNAIPTSSEEAFSRNNEVKHLMKKEGKR